MKKSIDVLITIGLCASIGLNGVLAYGLLQDREKDPVITIPLSGGTQQIHSRSDLVQETSSDTDPEMAETVPFREEFNGLSFLTADEAGMLQVAAALAEVGFDERQVRRMLHGAVRSEWEEERARRLLEKQGGVAWKPAAVFDPAEFADLLALRTEAEAALAATVGGVPPPGADDPLFASRLDPQRAEMLKRTEEAYRLLRQHTEHLMGAVRLDEDIEALQFLEAERRRDLAAFLSPDEVADFLLSEDHMGKRLRREFRYFEPSTEEMREIFRVQDLSRELSNEYFWTADLMKRDDLSDARHEALREILPPERYQELTEVTGLYSQVRGIADRLGYDREVAEAVLSFVQQTEAELQLLESNDSLSRAERRAMATELHERNRQAVLDQVGPEAAQIYKSSERRVR